MLPRAITRTKADIALSAWMKRRPSSVSRRYELSDAVAVDGLGATALATPIRTNTAEIKKLAASIQSTSAGPVAAIRTPATSGPSRPATRLIVAEAVFVLVRLT